MKENVASPFPPPPGKHPTPPLYPGEIHPSQSPAVLRARNLPPLTPTRQLFHTPRPSPVFRGSAPRAPRAGSASAPPAPRLPVSVHGAQTARAVVLGAGAGGGCSVALTFFARGILRIGLPDGPVGLAARVLGLLFATALSFVVVVACEGIAMAERTPQVSTLSFGALRFVFGSRARALHVALCIAVSVLHTLVLSAVVGAFDSPGATRGEQPPAFTAVAAASGAAFSFLAQTHGAFVWRFSPTRAPASARFRALMRPAAALAGAAVASGMVLSAAWLSSVRQLAAFTGAPPVPPGPGLLLQLGAAAATFCALLCWAVAVVAMQTNVTKPLVVSRYIADVSAGAIKADAQRNRDLVDALLSDLNPNLMLPNLPQLLSLQFFRDVARGSLPGRSAVFADASGNAWNALYAGCTAPIDALEQRLVNAAPMTRHGDMFPATGRTRAAGSARYALDFGESRSVVWAAEAISHFLVASREEDDYGVAQRTFLHIVMSLLRCKGAVDAARRRMTLAPVLVGDGRRSEKTMLTQMWEYRSPHDKYFATETVSTAVSDAINLAVFRLVDAFRVHVQGYLVGKEPHWDRSLDKTLKVCLEMTRV